MVETKFEAEDSREVFYGPTTTSLQAFVWKLRCPPKIQHFIWQMITGCVSVLKNLRSRGIQCDTQCGFCGEEEETINHVIFECPQAIQTWALSKIPSHPAIFPTLSVFTNLEYLFGIKPNNGTEGFFPWIIWYLWKSRNNKLYKGIDRNPENILILAETEGNMWEDAQEKVERDVERPQARVEIIQQGYWWCQVDGSWKSGDIFSGQGWVCTNQEMEDTMLGARNIRSSQSPLHAELEALIWAMECMQCLQRTRVVLTTDCSDIVKMVSSPEEWPAFAVHLDEYKRRKSMLEDIRISHIPRAMNTRADNLARSAREHPVEVVYVHSVPPSWLLNPF